MAVTPQSERDRRTGSREGSARARIARLAGAIALFGLALNLAISALRDNFLDRFAIVPYLCLWPILFLSVVICRDEFYAVFQSQRMRMLFYLLIQTALGAGLLAVGFYLTGYRYFRVWDCNTQQTFSFSEETERVLEVLAQGPPVEAIHLWGPEPQDEQLYRAVMRDRRRIAALLNAYRSSSEAFRPNAFRYSTLRMLEEPLRLETLARRTGIQTIPTAVAEGVLLLAGDGVRLLRSEDFVAISATASGQVTQPVFQGERIMTGALRNLLQPERKRFGYLEVEGSPRLEVLQRLQFLLKQQNLELRVVRQPDELNALDVLLAAGTLHNLPPELFGGIESYLARGGNAWFLIDPLSSSTEASNLKTSEIVELLKNKGVLVRQELVTRSIRPAVKGEPLPLATLEAGAQLEFAETILRGMQRATGPVRFIAPCALQLIEAAGYSPKALLSSHEYETRTLRTWAARPAERIPEQAGPEDLKGPVVLSAVMHRPLGDRAETGRLVVTAEAAWLQDAFLQRYPDNELFFLSVSQWLLGEERIAVNISPQDPHFPAVKLDEKQTLTLAVIFILLLPALALFAGLLMYFRRQS